MSPSWGMHPTPAGVQMFHNFQITGFGYKFSKYVNVFLAKIIIKYLRGTHFKE